MCLLDEGNALNSTIRSRIIIDSPILFLDGQSEVPVSSTKVEVHERGMSIQMEAPLLTEAPVDGSRLTGGRVFSDMAVQTEPRSRSTSRTSSPDVHPGLQRKRYTCIYSFNVDVFICLELESA